MQEELRFDLLEIVLKADVKFHEELIVDKLGNPAAVRSYVRSVFSCIEGFVYVLKQFALRYDKDGVLYSREEKAFLVEIEMDPRIDDNGKLRMNNVRISFIANVRFAFSMIQKIDKDKIPDISNSLISSLKKAVKIRDRLTHPKNQYCLLIKDTDLQIVREAYTLFMSEADQIVDVLRTRE